MPDSLNIIMIVGDRFADYAPVSGTGQLPIQEPAHAELAELTGPAVAQAIR